MREVTIDTQFPSVIFSRLIILVKIPITRVFLWQNVSNDRATKVLGDVDGLTEERVDGIVSGFLEDAKEDLLEKKGWPITLSAYILSKAALNALHKDSGQEVYIFLHKCS